MGFILTLSSDTKPIANNYGKKHLISGSNEHTSEKGLAFDQMM